MAARSGFGQDTDFLQVVSDICGLPAALWSTDFFWSGGVKQHPCEADKLLRQRLEAGCFQKKPGIFFENETVFWGLMRIGNYCVALGPAINNIAKDGYEKTYSAEHGLQKQLSLTKLSLGEMSKYISLLSSHFFCNALRYDEIEIHGFGEEHMVWKSEDTLEHYQLMQSENDRSHKSGIDYEGELIRAVRDGDVEQVKNLMGGVTPDIGEIGEVANEQRKQMEYMTVSLITLLTRASIEGGLRLEDAYELGDIYLSRLAAASVGGRAIMTLGLRAMIEFAERVKKGKEERSNSSYVEASKAYVEKNLRKDMKVSDIAPALGISRTYLAHLFKNAEGISLQQYIQREKCRHAERLLKFSDYPISLISEYFGFSSPSYFGTCFVHWYGITPSQYRRKYFRN